MLWLVTIFFIIVVWIISVYGMRHSMVRYHTPQWIQQEQIYMNNPPVHHEIIGIYLNNEENRNKIVELIESARHEVLFSSFCTDFVAPFYNGKSLDSYLLKARERGVRIILSLNHNQDEYTLIKNGLHSFIEKRKGLYDIITSVKSCKIFGFNYCNHHAKSLCIDKSLLFLGGGLDISNTLGGDFTSCNVDDVVCWTDISIITKCNKDIYKVLTGSNLHQYYKNISYINISGISEHNNFIYSIRNAQHYIYLENQFIDSGLWTENSIVRELANVLLTSIETGSNFRIIIITNTYHTADKSENSGLRWYINSCTQRIYRDIYHTITKLYPKATHKDIDDRLFIGYLKRSNYSIVIHTQFMVVDGIRMIKSSSNITDRSLSHSPCDKELGLMFYDPPKIGAFMQKIWNHRLETSNQQYTIQDVFRIAQRDGGQYRKTQKGILDGLHAALINTIYHFSYFTGPCKKGPFQNTICSNNTQN